MPTGSCCGASRRRRCRWRSAISCFDEQCRMGRAKRYPSKSHRMGRAQRYPSKTQRRPAKLIRIETLLPRDPSPRKIDATLTLPFEMRRRSRLLLKLDDGEEAGLFLERGTVLADGDELRAGDGRIVRIIAAREDVYCVRPTADCPLARAAYHLGN